MHGILTLIIDTIAAILAGALLLRFWTQAMRVRPPSSVAQFTYQVSDWLVKPMRRILPGVGGLDWASLIGAYLIILLAVAIEMLLLGAYSVQAILVFSIFRLIQWMLYGLMALFILDAIFSWVNPHAPLAPYVRALNDPLLRPLRRVIPAIGNIDFTPLVAMIIIQILLHLLGVAVRNAL